MIDRQTDKKTVRQAVRQANRKTDRQTEIDKYTAQNKYVCTRLFAFFDGLNSSLNKKEYSILNLVQFPIQL